MKAIYRILILILALISIFYCFAMGDTINNRFTDLTNEHWAYEPIMEMAQRGILVGYEDGSFRPDDSITRAEFSKILVLSFNLPKNNNPKDFIDVPEDHWAHGYIQTASLYLSPYRGEDKWLYYPSNIAIREDVATALVVAAGLEDDEYDLSALDRFVDKDLISPNLKKYIAIAVKNELIRGHDDGRFEPEGDLTRAQVCQLIKNMEVLIEKLSSTTENGSLPEISPSDANVEIIEDIGEKIDANNLGENNPKSPEENNMPDNPVEGIIEEEYPIVTEDITKEFKVLVIEIDPILYSITDKKLYGTKNGGHPRVSEFFDVDIDQAIHEMQEDITDCSHNYFDVKITREHLNEFPTYKSNVVENLENTSNRFDEKTYVSISKKSNSKKGDFWNMFENSRVSSIPRGSFSYDYLIDKFDLINRKKNNEFDQVWIFSMEPSSAYGTVMVGKDAYFVNGPQITSHNGKAIDCENFVIAGFNFHRRDSALHAWIFYVENVLKQALNDGMIMPNVSVSNYEQYKALNDFQKFFLNDYVNNGTLTSVGFANFPFNSTEEYEYNNSKKVLTNWKEWLKYPNMSDNFVLDNSNAWMTLPINTALGTKEEKNPNRLFMRFWLYLMPHVEGYSEKGYYNNWWKYLYHNDYVVSISSKEQQTIYSKVGNAIKVNYDVNYYFGHEENCRRIVEGNNVIISNNSVVGYKDGLLYATKVGETNVRVYRDGKYIDFHLIITN